MALSVEVVGGGVAGTCAAVVLARGGAEVVQWAQPERSGLRPPEVLSPGARAILGRLGFREPVDGVAQCAGVLSVWGSAEPDYHDYALFAGMPGLTVHREDLSKALTDFARQAGVLRREERWGGREVRRELPGCRPARRADRSTGPGLLLLANGRSAARSGRLRFDSTVALRMPFRYRRNGDRLLVEAAAEGWWYAVPSGYGAGSLCFLTDADLLPAGRIARQEWLLRLFGATCLIQAASDGWPEPAALSGVDAHFGAGQPFAWSGGARIGEAAVSLDPLSGTGVVRAAESGISAAREILECGAAGRAHSDFMSGLLVREQELRRAAFARAAHRFPDSPYWRRRV